MRQIASDGRYVCVSRDKVARHAHRIVDLAHAGLIVGVAVAGDELASTIGDLRQHLDRIRDQGVGIEIHAGEMGGPDSVRDALDHGRPDRIGHGVRAFEDPRLVARLAKERVHLEFCPTANLALGVVRTIEQVPIRQALSAGVEFSVNTDDPGVFQCSLSSELRLVQEAFALFDSDLRRIYRSALRAAFSRQNAGGGAE